MNSYVCMVCSKTRLNGMLGVSQKKQRTTKLVACVPGQTIPFGLLPASSLSHPHTTRVGVGQYGSGCRPARLLAGVEKKKNELIKRSDAKEDLNFQAMSTHVEWNIEQQRTPSIRKRSLP